jgi:hypothetical protein
VDPVKAGIDFSTAVFDEAVGKRCITKEEEVDSVERLKVLECTHKSVEKCHYTYVTQFIPSQEEVCQENYEKTCQITFKQQAYNETVRKCYRPTNKVCNGQGEEECRTVYESSCTTKYVEKQPGKFVGDTGCEKLPVKICGAGCTVEEGELECHDKTVVSAVQLPEEVCDLNPQRTCRFVTKLVPRLKPTHQCTIVPQEVCQLKLTSPQPVKKPLVTKWCLDESPPTPGELYDQTNSLDSAEEERFRALEDLDGSFVGPKILEGNFEFQQVLHSEHAAKVNQDESKDALLPLTAEDDSFDGGQLVVTEGDIGFTADLRTPTVHVQDNSFHEDTERTEEFNSRNVEEGPEIPTLEFSVPQLEFGLPRFEVPQSEFENDIDEKIPTFTVHSESVNREEQEDIEIERLKNFLAEDLEIREALILDGDIPVAKGSGELEDFVTFVDDTFPTQDFSAFVDFQEF